MIRWILSACALTILLSSSAFGQGFVAFIQYPSSYGAPPLSTECDGSTFIPDGRIVRLFQDADFNGPDPADPQPALCNNPPECLDGPPGTVNFNQFLTNGVAQGYGAGYFNTSPPWASVNATPPGLPVFYLRIYEPDGITVLWTSTTFILTSGYHEVIFGIDDMTCGQGGPQCLVLDESE